MFKPVIIIFTEGFIQVFICSLQTRFPWGFGKFWCHYSAAWFPHLQLWLEQGIHFTRSVANQHIIETLGVCFWTSQRLNLCAFLYRSGSHSPSASIESLRWTSWVLASVISQWVKFLSVLFKCHFTPLDLELWLLFLLRLFNASYISYCCILLCFVTYP